MNKWQQAALLGLAAVLLLSFWAGLWYQSNRLNPEILLPSGADTVPEASEASEAADPRKGWAEPKGGEAAALDLGQGTSQGHDLGQGSIAGETAAPKTQDTRVLEARLAVHVIGRVQNPGLYYLQADGRIDDAVQAACPLADANLARINLALPLRDGMQIRVPQVGKKDPWPAGQLIVTADQWTKDNSPREANLTLEELRTGQLSPGGDGRLVSKLDLNQANQSQLEALPGIGPIYARRIIEYRQKNGMFSRIEDLRQVKGIGEALVGQIKDLVVCGR